MLQEAAREFAMREVLPLANKLDPERGEIPESLMQQLAEMGYLGIVIPEDARRISISTDGEVVAYFASEAEGQPIGTLSLVRFVNEKGLEAMGDNMFRETEASGAPNRLVPATEGVGLLRQGYLEESGVDVVQEISELIEAQRGYELNSKVISAADEMLAATTRVR